MFNQDEKSMVNHAVDLCHLHPVSLTILYPISATHVVFIWTGKEEEDMNHKGMLVESIDKTTSSYE